MPPMIAIHFVWEWRRKLIVTSNVVAQGRAARGPSRLDAG